MVRHTRPALVAAMIGLAVLLVAPHVYAYNLWTAPFDTAISVYVGCSGQWYHAPAGETTTAEVEGDLSLYSPTETVTDDVADWCEHQVNQPAVPQGWQFWYPDDEQPMTLHVIIHDTQNRLGEVVVTRLASGAPVGTLAANQQGSEIGGTLSLTSAEDPLVLIVKAHGTGATLVKAGAVNEGMDDVIAFCPQDYYAWVPRSGDQPPPTGCPANPQPPYGDPQSVDGIVSTLLSQTVGRSACAGHCAFVNDTPTPGSVAPNYWLKDKFIRKDTIGVWAGGPGFPETGAESVDAKITAAKGEFLPAVDIVQNYAPPPYSQGVAHWFLNVAGHTNPVLYVPVKQRNKTHVSPVASAAFSASLPGGDGSTLVLPELKAQFGYQLASSSVAKMCGTPVGVGEVWGLLCTNTQTPVAWPVTGIKSDVTFELWGDITAPDGLPGPMAGVGTATVGAALTTPSPPQAVGVNLTFGQDGLCAVPLNKGWRWTATAHPMSPYYSTGSSGEFQLPPGPAGGTIRITCELRNLLSLKIKTTRNGQPFPAPLQLEWKPTPGANWTPLPVPAPTYVGGEYITFVGTRPPGAYRVRGQGMGMPPPPKWSEWQEFTVVPALEQTIAVSVP